MHKRNRKFQWCLVICILAASANPAFAAGGLTIMYGKKTLDTDNWRPVESQQETGFSLEFQGKNWPVAVIASYLKSEGTATGTGLGFTAKVKGSTTEVGLGIRKYLNKSRIRYFVEAGLMSVKADMSVEIAGYYSGTASANDTGNGYWIGAGTSSMLSDAWSIGILGRISRADVSLDGLNGNAGGRHLNFMLTHHFD